MRVQFTVLLLLIASFCLALEAPVTMDTLVQQSDRIVRGRVTHLAYRAGTNEFGDQLIFTDVSIETFEALKGDRSNFILIVEGGTLNGITLAVSDALQFKVGDEVLVFAKKQATSYLPSGGSQSKYTISKEGKILERGIYYNEFKKSIMDSINKMRGEQ